MEEESLVQLLGLSTEERMLRTIMVQEKRIKGLRKGLSRCVTGSNNSKKIMAKISPTPIVEEVSYHMQVSKGK